MRISSVYLVLVIGHAVAAVSSTMLKEDAHPELQTSRSMKSRRRKGGLGTAPGAASITLPPVTVAVPPVAAALGGAAPLAPPPPAAVCDEPALIEPRSDPASAKEKYEQDFQRFPTHPVGDCTASVDGFPVGFRPRLFAQDMFTNQAGEPLKNFNAHDLPVMETYYDDDGRPIDIFETMTVESRQVDMFQSDGCAPGGYQSTEFALYGSASVPHFSPGPTVKSCTGRQNLVRFENNFRRNVGIHLHGAGSVAPYDGWADDVTPPSYAKNYLYPCNRAATLWYHDHAVHITADNAYAGLAGQFIVKDCETDLEKNYLPTEEHSIPLVVRDAIIDTQPPYNLVYHGGRLSAVGAHEDFLYGDINLVNGKPWPKLEVDPITYRMRALNPSLSRQFMLKFLAESSAGRQTWIPFWMLQSDGGALRDMVQTHSLFLAVAERYTIAVNFDPLSVVYPLLPDGETWSHVYLVNDFGPSGNQPPMFCKTHLLARFDLASRTSARPSPQGIDRELTRSGGTNNPPPMVLSRQGKPYLGLRNVVPQSEIDAGMELARRGDFHREFDFGRANGHWVINGCVWDDESCRIIANPKRNGVEVWKLKGHGGWTHPVHIHEIDFLILRRTGGSTDLWEDYDPLKPNGQPEPKFVTLPDTAKDVGLDAPWVEDEVRPWEWNAAKDVVHLGEGQDVWVLARYGSNDGDFMFHCHNLVHEDNDMMVAIGIGRTKPSSASDIALTDVQGADYWNVAPDAAVTPEELWALGPSSPGGENISPYAPQISGKVDVELRNAMGDVARPLTADDRFANGRVSPTYICERLCRKIYASYFPSNPSQGSPRGETEDPFILNNVWAAHWQHWKRGDESEDLSTTGFQNLHPNYQKHDRDSDACDCSLVRE